MVVIDNRFISFCVFGKLRNLELFVTLSSDLYGVSDVSLPVSIISSEMFRTSDEYENKDDMSVNIDDFGVEMSDDVPDDFLRSVKLNKEL